MSACEMIRKVAAGPLSIRLWVAAEDDTPCECDERADELALCAATIADGDDNPTMLACKLISLLRGVSAVEVLDEHGNGCTLRERFDDC